MVRMPRSRAGLLGIIAGGALGVRLLTAASAFAASDDPAAAEVQALQSSINANDVEGAARLFADDAVVIQPRIGGLPQIYVGREEIRWWLRSLAAQHVHLDVAAAPRIIGDHVEWTENFSVDAFRGLGLATVDVDVDAVLATDERIESLRTTLTPQAARSIQGSPGAAADDTNSDATSGQGTMALVGIAFAAGVGISVLAERRRASGRPAASDAVHDRLLLGTEGSPATHLKRDRAQELPLPVGARDQAGELRRAWRG
jgi:hypothetical protein